MKPPCKDCKKRYTACHDSCDDYKEWKTFLDNRKCSDPFEYTYRSKATQRNWERKGRYKKSNRFIKDKH